MSEAPDGGRELAPLRGGRHGLSREQVTQSQRERLLAAAVQVVARDGYQASTVHEIARTASVSSRDFYENFSGKEECFLSAFDIVVEHTRALLTEAAEPEPDWAHETIAGMRAAMRFASAEQDLTHVCLIAALTASPAILVRRSEALLEMVPFLRRGREQRGGAEPLPESTEESVIGGLVVLVARSIGTGRSLEAVFPDLVDFVLSPYLGPERASELAEEVRQKGVLKKR